MSTTTLRAVIARHRHIDITTALSAQQTPLDWPADLWEGVQTGQITLRRARAVRAERGERSPEEAGPLVCAECGSGTADAYVVTILDNADPKGTRSELCAACDAALRPGELPVRGYL